jgi:hypothetical protein
MYIRDTRNERKENREENKSGRGGGGGGRGTVATSGRVKTKEVRCCRPKTKGCRMLLFLLVICAKEYLNFVHTSFIRLRYLFYVRRDSRCVITL